MKSRKNLVITVVGVLLVAFAPVAPCRAGWNWLNSFESSGPWYGYNYDSGSGYQLEEMFRGSNINTDADSSGCSAEGDLEANSSVEVQSSGGTISKSAYAYCSAWGNSNYYYSKDHPSDTPSDLYVTWDLDGYGNVDVSGSVSPSLNVNDSGDASSFAYSDVDGGEEYAGGYASGSASETGNGSANKDVSGIATLDTSSETETANYYAASLSWSVNSNDTYTLSGYWQYSAEAELNVSTSAAASVTVTQGYSATAMSAADADCSATVSVSISW